MSTVAWGQKECASSACTLVRPEGTTSSSTLVAATPSVLCLSWNYDATVLAVGTVDGFLVYNAEALPRAPCAASAHASDTSDERRHTLVEVARRYVGGGVQHIAIHDQGSLLLFSPREAGQTHPAATGSSRPQPSRVVLWNDALWDASSRASLLHDSDPSADCVVGSLMLPSPVAGLRLHDRLILVAEPYRVHIYDTKLAHVETLVTPNHGRRSSEMSEHGDMGLHWDNSCQTIALATFASRESFRGAECSILRCVVLGPTAGCVRCLHFFYDSAAIAQRNTAVRQRASSTTRAETVNDDRFVESKLVEPPPHTHRIQCLTISADGAYALSCSERGTSIKLIDVKRASVLRQLNRGMTLSAVGSLTLSVDNALAACVSANGTVHIFSLSSTVGRGDATGGSELTAATALSKTAAAVVAQSVRALQAVAPTRAGHTISNMQAFASSDYAACTFSLSLTNSDADALFLRHSFGSESEKRSERSEAFVLESEGSLQRELDVSEHSGFDPLFTAVQFRSLGATVQRLGDAARANQHVVHVLLACGNVTPSSFRIKSKCVQVVVSLAAGPAGASDWVCKPFVLGTALFPSEDL